MRGKISKQRPAKKLRIRLISGHHLPKIAGKIKGNVIQPYVKIKIRGHQIDESEYVTEVVPKVSFFVVCPRLWRLKHKLSPRYISLEWLSYICRWTQFRSIWEDSAEKLFQENGKDTPAKVLPTLSILVSEDPIW